MNFPLVSIITSVYNSEKYINETIKSVLWQTYKNFEMILVDDCSTDNSLNVIQPFIEQDSRIKLIQLPENSGAAVARNAAIEAARGQYIAFLDSDDIWLPDKLQKQLNFMEKNNYPFVFSAYDKIDNKGEIFGHVGVPNKVSYIDILKTCSIGCLTVVYDTECFGKVYMPLIRKRQDFGLWLRLLKKTNYAYGLNETLAQYRVHSDSISANKVNAAIFTWCLYRDIEQLNIAKSLYYFIHYAVRGFFRNKIPKLARALKLLQ